MSDTLQTRDGRSYNLADCSRVYQGTVSATADVMAICWELNYSDCIWFAEPLFRDSLDSFPWSPPDDSIYVLGAQWNLNDEERWAGDPSGYDIGAVWAWRKCTGDTAIVVSLMDTGVDRDHDDFGGGYGEGYKILGGWDYVYDSSYFEDSCPHGTMTSGLVGALTNNDGVGIASIAGGDGESVGTRLFMQKIFDGCTGITAAKRRAWEDVATGEVHADVLLNAFRGRYYRFVDHLILRNVYAAGIPLVASRGNYAGNERRYPSGYDEHWIVSVGAMDTTGTLHHNSGWGADMDFIAPGNRVTSTSTNNGYSTGGGSSYAAAMVAGCASLILGYQEESAVSDLDLWPEDVAALLKASCAEIGEKGYDDSTGWGRVNGGKALYLMENFVHFVQGQVSGGSQYGQPFDPDTVYFFPLWDTTSAYRARLMEVRTDVTFGVEFADTPFVWGRGSDGASRGYNKYNPQIQTMWCEPVPGTVGRTGCTMRTYVYDVWEWDIDPDSVYVGRFPCDPEDCLFGYGAVGPVPPPRSWYDDCGDPENEPNLVQGTDFTCCGSDSLYKRTMSTTANGDVVYEYTDLYPDAQYTVTAWCRYCEDIGFNVCQAVYADSQMLAEAECLTAGAYPYGPYTVDSDVYAEDREFQIIFKKEFPGQPLVPSGTAVSWIMVEETMPALEVESEGGERPTFESVVVYPNPFNPTTTITYTLPEPGHVTVQIYDVLGRRVATLADGPQEAGRKRIDWVAPNVASGVYFCRVEACGQVVVRKLVMVR